MGKGITIIILGPPGSGKGTQALRVGKKIGAKIFGTGELLRVLAQEKSFLGTRVRKILAEGQLVPTWLASFVWIRELGRTKLTDNIIFDGSPRTSEEAQLLDEVLAWYGRKKIKVVFIRIDAQESLRRIVSRRVCVRCRFPIRDGKEESIEASCQRCGGKLIRRDDDTRATIRKRLRVFAKQEASIVAHYRAKKTLITIDGQGSTETVTRAFINKISL